MINLVKKFFGEKAPEQKQKEESHDIRVATCALLLEMANIDGEFNEKEQERIISILKQDFCLSDEYISELIKTSHEELKESVDLWQFASLINKNYSHDEKIRIMEMVWKVVYADKKLDKHEDYLVHKLAKLLHLSHKELIDGKLKTLHKS